jgi:D-alanyl-D-alanine carboxypeptidase
MTRWQVLLLPLFGCASAGNVEDRLQAALDTVVENDPKVAGATLVVRSPDFEFAGVSGKVSLDDGARALASDDVFRVASVTKSFVAAAVIAQAHEGILDLDDPVRTRLSDESITALVRGGYDVDAITVRQLLAHTAGIYDYTEAPSFYPTINANPSHRWTRAEQLQLAMDEGELLNTPGEAYAYGDTHYILAGEVLERATGLGLASSLRNVLGFDELGLDSTWLESMEETPDSGAMDRLTHPYDGRTDTRDWDASWDLYGGGGLVSSPADLATFFNALFSGDVLEGDALEEMLDVASVSKGAFYGIDGALGIARFRLDDGAECWAGYGYFGTTVSHCPDDELTYAYALNQSEPRAPDALDAAVLDEL